MNANTDTKHFPERLVDTTLYRANEVPGAAAIPADQLHSETGPSAADRVYHCPGSVRLSALVPDQQTPHAERGTELHDAARFCLEHNATADRLEPAIDNPLDREAVDYVVGEVRRTPCPPEGIELWEERIDLEATGAGFGTIDHAVVVPGAWAALHDFKFGDRPVRHPKYNWQMILYAWGLMDAFDLAEVRAVVLRPSAEPEWQRMEHVFDAETLRRAGREYLQRALVARNPDAPLAPGGHCDFCRAKQMCPARWATVATTPRHMNFAELLERLDPVELRDLYERAKIARSQISALVARIEQAALAGEIQVASYDVETSRGNREWAGLTTEVERTLAALCQQKGVDPEKIWQPKQLISPAQAEKILGKAKRVKEKMDALVGHGEGKPKLVKVGR
jgi:hypothetical protein